ncbi:hypothetical protein B0T18DRAFT_227494 [Schizothecium vesticola]|uniref:Uncharacterized protein n=1 Tax=Schizothecium vesticola TaxID=314040 RepID=A0AA40EL04_9PEZI|nr:hypothetical protein B0T18DRAFT_227494 [Schizothecium vesticola]
MGKARRGTSAGTKTPRQRRPQRGRARGRGRKQTWWRVGWEYRERWEHRAAGASHRCCRRCGRRCHLCHRCYRRRERGGRRWWHEEVHVGSRCLCRWSGHLEGARGSCCRTCWEGVGRRRGGGRRQQRSKTGRGRGRDGDDGRRGIDHAAAGTWNGGDVDRRGDGRWWLLGAGPGLCGTDLWLYRAGLGLSGGQWSIREWQAVNSLRKCGWSGQRELGMDASGGAVACKTPARDARGRPAGGGSCEGPGGGWVG